MGNELAPLFEVVTATKDPSSRRRTPGSGWSELTTGLAKEDSEEAEQAQSRSRK